MLNHFLHSQELVFCVLGYNLVHLGDAMESASINLYTNLNVEPPYYGPPEGFWIISDICAYHADSLYRPDTLAPLPWYQYKLTYSTCPFSKKVK